MFLPQFDYQHKDVNKVIDIDLWCVETNSHFNQIPRIYCTFAPVWTLNIESVLRYTLVLHNGIKCYIFEVCILDLQYFAVAYFLWFPFLLKHLIYETVFTVFWIEHFAYQWNKKKMKPH